MPKILEKVFLFLICFTCLYGILLTKSKNRMVRTQNSEKIKQIVVKKIVPRPILQEIDCLKTIETLLDQLQLTDFNFNQRSGTFVLKGQEKYLKNFWFQLLNQEEFWLNQNSLRLTLEQGRNEKITNLVKWEKDWFIKRKGTAWQIKQLKIVTIFSNNDEIFAVLRTPDRQILTVKKGHKVAGHQIVDLNFQKITFDRDQELKWKH